MVDLGFRVDEGLKILLYRKCSKYNLGPCVDSQRTSGEGYRM